MHDSIIKVVTVCNNEANKFLYIIIEAEGSMEKCPLPLHCPDPIKYLSRPKIISPDPLIIWTRTLFCLCRYALHLDFIEGKKRPTFGSVTKPGKNKTWSGLVSFRSASAHCQGRGDCLDIIHKKYIFLTIVKTFVLYTLITDFSYRWGRRYQPLVEGSMQ